MNELKDDKLDIFYIKIIQSGIIKSYSLHKIIDRKFNEVYIPLLKDLKINKRDVLLTNENGKALGDYELNLPIPQIIKKFGYKINLYCEKIL
jgi:hypothetical protein